MATVRVASEANQATTVPALLVASYANEADPNSSINVKFEEVENLESGNKAVIELVEASNTPVYGSEEIIRTIVAAHPIIQGKDKSLVGYSAL